MEELSLLQRIAVWALPVLFAITVHEVAHGWVARKLGDPTAMMLGRLTLNPLKHIDPFGTVLLPLLMVILKFPFIFGWAKPVPVTWGNLKHPKRDMALVAVAGPASNLLMALLWAGVMKIGVMSSASLDGVAQFMIYVGGAGIFINVILLVLNLVPIPPLDGGRVLSGLLPGPWSWQLNRIEPYGMIILILLLVSGVLNEVINPPVQALQGMLYSLVAL